MKILSYIKKIFTKNTFQALTVRSGKWRTVRRTHLEKNPACAACGTTKQLIVHHCKPVYLNPERELDFENLITLCEKNNCHFAFGHFYNWNSFNENVREDAANWLLKIKNRP